MFEVLLSKISKVFLFLLGWDFNTNIVELSDDLKTYNNIVIVIQNTSKIDFIILWFYFKFIKTKFIFSIDNNSGINNSHSIILTTMESDYHRIANDHRAIIMALSLNYKLNRLEYEYIELENLTKNISDRLLRIFFGKIPPLFPCSNDIIHSNYKRSEINIINPQRNRQINLIFLTLYYFGFIKSSIYTDIIQIILLGHLLRSFI